MFQEPFQLNHLFLFSRAKFLETEEKKCYFSENIFYRINKLPFKGNAGAGDSAGGAQFL